MLTYEGVIQEFFADREFPVIYDLDIGHYPPNLTLVNGSLARVEFFGDGGKIFQSLVP